MASTAKRIVCVCACVGVHMCLCVCVALASTPVDVHPLTPGIAFIDF